MMSVADDAVQDRNVSGIIVGRIRNLNGDVSIYAGA